MEGVGVVNDIAGLVGQAETIASQTWRFCFRAENTNSGIRDLLVEIQSLYGALSSLKLLATCLENDNPSLKFLSFTDLDHVQTCQKILDVLKIELDEIDLESTKAELAWPFEAGETKEIVEKLAGNRRDLSDALTTDSLSTFLEALSTNFKLLETVQNVQNGLDNLLEETAEKEKVQAKFRHSEIVKLLLDNGASDGLNKDSQTVVQECFKKYSSGFSQKHVEMAQEFIQRGSSPIDENGNTLLHIIFNQFKVEHFESAVFKEIVSLVIHDPAIISKANNDGLLPLRIAIWRGFPSKIIKMVIPPLEIWNISGVHRKSPLHEAVCPELSKAQITPTPQHSKEETTTTNGDASLRMLELLLDIPGVNVDVLDTRGLTPLVAVAMNCPPSPKPHDSETTAKLIKKLLEHGANINACGTRGFILVHHLAAKGHAMALMEALRFSPDVKAWNDDGNSAFDLASVYGRVGALKLLREYVSKSPGGVDSLLSRRNRVGTLPIHLAAWNRRHEVIEFLYESGDKYLNEPTLDHIRESPLHLAVRANHPQTVLALLRLGANVSIRNKRSHTPLHHAAYHGLSEIAEILLEEGADVVAEDRDGSQPWVLAALNGHTTLSDLLVTASQKELKNEGLSFKVTDSNEEDYSKKDNGSRPKKNPRWKEPFSQRYADTMIKAIENPDPKGSASIACEALLRVGRSPNEILNEDQDTCIHYATRSNSTEVLKLLLRYGGCVHTRNSFGDQPIHLTTWRGNLDATNVLLEYGANIKERNSFMQTPLHIAATHDHLEIVQAILEHAIRQGIKTEMLEFRDCERRTALIKALDNENLEISKYLVEQGADVHVKCFGGLNAFYFASEFADKALMETLLSRGLDVNNTTYGGFNSLHFAAGRQTEPEDWPEQTEICLRLIKEGASLSSDNPARVSPLHSACHSGNRSLVEELLKLMPAEEINVESGYYGTPLWAAAFRGHLDVVKLLLEQGADIDMRRDGESPLEAAIKEEHEEVAELLSESWWAHQQVEATGKILQDLSLGPMGSE